jgi:hypothetical protein
MSDLQPRKLFFKHILRKIFLEDWALKLLALAITVALWLGVTGLSTQVTRSIVVPLNSIISNDAIITNTLRQEVEIVLRGDKRAIEQLNRGDISASLDLTLFKPGDWVVPLSPDTVSVNNLAPGLTLEEVRPNNMAVKLEAVAEKEIAVKAETSGTVASGFEIYSTAVLPPMIRVRGPASIMKMLQYVKTEKIDITGKKEEFTARQIAVTSLNPQAAVLNTVVDVYFRIGERRIERSFLLPIPGVTGKTARFVVYGPRTLLAKVRTDEFKIEMYLDDNGEEAPRVIVPAELQDMVDIRKLKLN